MSLLVPLLSVIAIWWIGTGVVLYLQQRINQPGTALIAALIITSVVCLLILMQSSHSLSALHTYVGFIAAVILWGTIELSYYSGLISGTHRQPCPAHCTTRERFRMALGASLWHELSVLLCGVLLILLLWDAANPTGLYAFLVLWLMRWSAKLNLFLGVPNFNTDWFPDRLAYAHSYIRRAPVSLFFLASVGIASVCAWLMLRSTDTLPSADALTLQLPAVLLMLAILEHIFMALPIADNDLWNRIFSRTDTDADVNDTNLRREHAGGASTSMESVSVSVRRVNNRLPTGCVDNPVSHSLTP